MGGGLNSSLPETAANKPGETGLGRRKRGNEERGRVSQL